MDSLQYIYLLLDLWIIYNIIIGPYLVLDQWIIYNIYVLLAVLGSI